MQDALVLAMEVHESPQQSAPEPQTLAEGQGAARLLLDIDQTRAGELHHEAPRGKQVAGQLSFGHPVQSLNRAASAGGLELGVDGLG